MTLPLMHVIVQIGCQLYWLPGCGIFIWMKESYPVYGVPLGAMLLLINLVHGQLQVDATFSKRSVLGRAQYRNSGGDGNQRWCSSLKDFKRTGSTRNNQPCKLFLTFLPFCSRTNNVVLGLGLTINLKT